MLTQERTRELLGKDLKILGYGDVTEGGGHMFIRDDVVLSAMTRAVQEAVEEAAKVAEDRALDNEPPHMRIRLGIAAKIRSLAHKEDK